MNNFKVIEHTADIGIQAYGATLREAFKNVAQGMFDLITDLEKIEANKSFQLELQADSYEDLLVAWLNRLLYIYEVEKVILNQYQIKEMSAYSLKATVCGELIDLNKHILKTHIKAATYHQLQVEPGDEICRLQVIFDV